MEVEQGLVLERGQVRSVFDGKKNWMSTKERNEEGYTSECDSRVLDGLTS